MCRMDLLAWKIEQDWHCITSQSITDHGLYVDVQEKNDLRTVSNSGSLLETADRESEKHASFSKSRSLQLETTDRESHSLTVKEEIMLKNVVSSREKSVSVRGYYSVKRGHIAQTPTHLNLTLGHTLYVDFIFSDGWCHGYVSMRSI